MSGWRRHFELVFQARVGLGSGVFIWAVVALICIVAAFGFLLLSAYIWLAQLLDPLAAALILAGFFLVVAMITLSFAWWMHQRIRHNAQLALATRKPAPWLDPMFLGMAMQVGRSLGWRKTAPLLALGLLATGVALQWVGRNKSDSSTAGTDE
jgi:hypothetical protein